MEKVLIEDLPNNIDRKRYDPALLSYKEHFGETPDFFVRCPGRVNLIGEHIDYSGFPVLPIAIQKYIIAAFGPSHDGNINILNVEEANYPKYSVAFKDILINKGSPRWYDYILCGLLGICEKYNLDSVSLNVVIHGNVPPASGLSSSSALVCAAALGVAYHHKIHPGKVEIADLCAYAEHRIGTQGGGMDQAIIFLAEEGVAKKIEFNPLQTTSVQLPDQLSYVVAHSGVSMNKAATSVFNKRVVECKLAAKVLAKCLNLPWKSVNKLCEIPNQLNKKPGEMLPVVKEYLTSAEYGRKEIGCLLGIDEAGLQTILDDILPSDSSNLQHFKLAQRATHVFKEAANVELFIESCCENNIKAIGSLLSASHSSLKDNYECSHEKLDELVQLAVQSGAIGARLTGAGWGGCIIAAVEQDKTNELVKRLKSHAEKEGLSPESVFLTRPRGGATILLIASK